RSVRSQLTRTPTMRAPTTSPRRSRATVSTSGSSGIGRAHRLAEGTARGEIHLEAELADELVGHGPAWQLPPDPSIEQVDLLAGSFWRRPLPPGARLDLAALPAVQLEMRPIPVQDFGPVRRRRKQRPKHRGRIEPVEADAAPLVRGLLRDDGRGRKRRLPLRAKPKRIGRDGLRVHAGHATSRPGRSAPPRVPR